MSITITIEAWWFGVYVAIGALLFVPLNYLVWKRLGEPKAPFGVRYFTRQGWPHAIAGTLLQVIAWPLSIIEEYM